MKPFPEPQGSIEETAKLVAAGLVSAVSIVEDCLARIDEWEPKVHAWVVVDRAGALKQARQLDHDREAKRSPGPLHGIPIGIKDIIDVEGLPTSAGARLWGEGKPAEADAELVAKLRKAGAIILGKTVTTPYAWIDPPPTRNPWNFDRTPGGSSSGSAVAVATGMCLGSFGTQTGGSIIRPAAYCGVAGLKPFSWSIESAGIVPFAPTLDTPGPFALTVGGLRRLYLATTRYSGIPGEETPKKFHADGPRPRFGRLRGMFEELADPEMNQAIDDAVAQLQSAGAIVADIELPEGFDSIRQAHRVVMAAEAAVQHGARFADLPDDYPPRIAELIDEGRPIPASDYIRAQSLKQRLWNEVRSVFRETTGGFFFGHLRIDAFLMPSAPGPAPGRATTGDPVFNSPWTFLDFPAVSLPIGLSDDGLPLAIQLVSDGYDLELLDLAQWSETALRVPPPSGMTHVDR